MLIQRGFREKISKHFNPNQEIVLSIELQGSEIYDFCCFGIDENERLLNDGYMIFYNQLTSPENVVKMILSENSAHISIYLEKAPTTLDKFVFTINTDDTGSIKSINNGQIKISQSGREVLSFHISGNEFEKEKAIIAIELYRRNNEWRIAAIAMGFNGGLADLLRLYGGEEATEQPEQQPQIETVVAPPSPEVPQPTQPTQRRQPITIPPPAPATSTPPTPSTPPRISLQRDAIGGYLNRIKSGFSDIVGNSKRDEEIERLTTEITRITLEHSQLTSELNQVTIERNQATAELNQLITESNQLKSILTPEVMNIINTNNALVLLQEKVTNLQGNYQKIINDLDKKVENKQTLINEIINNAKKEATIQVNTELAKSKNYLEYLKEEIRKTEELHKEVSELKEQQVLLTRNIVSWDKKLNRLKTIYKSVNNTVKKYLFEYDNVTKGLINVQIPSELMSEINTLAPSATLKLHSMDYKDLRKAFNDNEKLIIETLTKYEGNYTTKTNAAICKLMVIGLRAELQNVLYTLSYSKLDDSLSAIREIVKKYLNIAESGNRVIASNIVKFIGELEYLFIEAVKIEYEYYVKKEAARQEQFAIREQMRQEAEERRLLEQQRQQIEKEESKYRTEIENINLQIQASNDDEKTRQLLEKIKELEGQLQDVENKKEDIVNLQNGKAGYVYIISNLGSFGDDVFKVGMTRRLNPQDRVDELGDASVPFKFDVHSFIFSEDAVQLESNLHTALETNRLNKVNLRKEFFKISIDELEDLVNEFDSTAEFNRTMIAEQYRQSLPIELLEE